MGCSAGVAVDVAAIWIRSGHVKSRAYTFGLATNVSEECLTLQLPAGRSSFWKTLLLREAPIFFTSFF
ncbi:MAG: hypothetical protein ACK55Z_22635 [bacterium]